MRKHADLDELIQILEKEKTLLKNTISEHLNEGDYRVANRYSKGLAEVSARLSILYQFRDPYKQEVDRLAQQKKSLTKQIDKYKNNEFMTDYLLDQLNQMNDQTREIVARNIEPFQDTQHIDDALFDIAAGVINSFQLIFKDKLIDIKFERKPGDILDMSIGPAKALRKIYLMRKRNKRALESLGFHLESSRERYVYHYDLKTFKDALVIKTLLARLFYDVFTRWYPYEIPNVELRFT